LRQRHYSSYSGKALPACHYTGLEIQENLALLAQKNTQLNGLDSRIKILTGDAQK